MEALCFDHHSRTKLGSTIYVRIIINIYLIFGAENDFLLKYKLFKLTLQ